jgi:hypothetical protein
MKEFDVRPHMGPTYHDHRLELKQPRLAGADLTTYVPHHKGVMYDELRLISKIRRRPVDPCVKSICIDLMTRL